MVHSAWRHATRLSRPRAERMGGQEQEGLVRGEPPHPARKKYERVTKYVPKLSLHMGESGAERQASTHARRKRKKHTRKNADANGLESRSTRTGQERKLSSGPLWRARNYSGVSALWLCPLPWCRMNATRLHASPRNSPRLEDPELAGRGEFRGRVGRRAGCTPSSPIPVGHSSEPTSLSSAKP